MADVQPERHFLRLHRDILTALCAVKIGRTALRVALAIVRASYGFNEATTGGRLHVSTLSQICGGLDHALIRRALRELEDYGIIEPVTRGSSATHTATEYRILKDWEQWAGMPRDWSMTWGEKPLRTDGSPAYGLTGPQPTDSVVPTLGTDESPIRREREKREREEREQTRFALVVESPKTDNAQIVANHYRSRRGQTRPIAGKALDRIRALLKKHTVEDLVLVIDWSKDAPDSDHLRANDRGKDYTRWSTIFGPGNFGKYHDMACDWRDGGSTKAPQSAADHWSGLTPDERRNWPTRLKRDVVAHCDRHLDTGKFYPVSYLHDFWAKGQVHLAWVPDFRGRYGELLAADKDPNDPWLYEDLMDKHNMAKPHEVKGERMTAWLLGVDGEKTRRERLAFDGRSA